MSFERITSPKTLEIPVPDQNMTKISSAERLSETSPLDDNDRPYRTDDGGWIPNNSYELEGINYKTDDLGNIYQVDGEYYPDDFFVLDGILYLTDEEGDLLYDDAPSEPSENQPEVSEIRELTNDEKNSLKDNLGWSEKQLEKCTIDKDGIIHYRTDNCDLENKTSETGVRYENKVIKIEGVEIKGVFPVFESQYDTELPEDKQKSKAYAAECNRNLKESVLNNSELKDCFTEKQLDEIENGRTPTGYVWHHNEEPGKMQLVSQSDHQSNRHTGGNALWGPDSTDRGQKGEQF